MKLISSRSKGRHAIKDADRNSKDHAGKASDKTGALTKQLHMKITNMKGALSKLWRMKFTKKLAIIAGAILLLAGICLAVVYTPLWDFFFKPSLDALAAPIPPRSSSGQGKNDPLADGEGYLDGGRGEIEEAREDSKYTFLLMGIDGTGNTDVIIVGTFDTTEYTLEFASIPRDTIVNVSWSLKKVNSIYSVMRNQNRNEDDAEAKAMKAVIDKFSDILGYRVDFWATINMRAFISLIDAIGGVWFDVPVGMNWYDPELNMTFSLSRGSQTLRGQQALGLMRYRAGYSNADIGRINTRQNFLKAAMEQILANKSSVNIANLAEIFLKYVKTDIPLNNLLWFGREFLKVSGEDINFTTMPHRLESVGGGSYVSIILDEWLEIVNTKLSPSTRVITEKDVSILTRGADKRLYVTDGNWQGNPSWGASSRGG